MSSCFLCASHILGFDVAVPINSSECRPQCGRLFGSLRRLLFHLKVSLVARICARNLPFSVYASVIAGICQSFAVSRHTIFHTIGNIFPGTGIAQCIELRSLLLILAVIVLCKVILVYRSVVAPESYIIGSTVGIAGQLKVAAHLHSRPYCHTAPVTDTAVPQLIQDRHALSVFRPAEIVVKILQRCKIDQIFLTAAIHIRHTAIVIDLIHIAVFHFHRLLLPVFTVWLCRIQNAQFCILCLGVRPGSRRLRGGDHKISDPFAVKIIVLIYDRSCTSKRSIGVRIKLLQDIQCRQVVILHLVIRLRIEILRSDVMLFIFLIIRPDRLAAKAHIPADINSGHKRRGGIALLPG